MKQLKTSVPVSGIETTEPLIIWTLQFETDVILMPEFRALINLFYCLN
jgi:hypothetical protein